MEGEVGVGTGEKEGVGIGKTDIQVEWKRKLYIGFLLSYDKGGDRRVGSWKNEGPGSSPLLRPPPHLPRSHLPRCRHRGLGGGPRTFLRTLHPNPGPTVPTQTRDT